MAKANNDNARSVPTESMEYLLSQEAPPPTAPPPIVPSAKEESNADDFDAQLKKLFYEQGDTAFDVSVKRFNPATKTWPQISSFTDVSDISEIPGTEEIGRAYGGGKYKMSIRYELASGELKNWSRVFELDKSYDRHVDKPAAPAAQNSGTDMMQTMLMLSERQEKSSERMMELIVTMMTATQTAMANMATAFAGKPAESLNMELVKKLIDSKGGSKLDEIRDVFALAKELAPQQPPEPEYEGEQGEEQAETGDNDILELIQNVVSLFGGGQQQTQQTQQQLPSAGGGGSNVT